MKATMVLRAANADGNVLLGDPSGIQAIADALRYSLANRGTLKSSPSQTPAHLLMPHAPMPIVLIVPAAYVCAHPYLSPLCAALLHTDLRYNGIARSRGRQTFGHALRC